MPRISVRGPTGPPVEHHFDQDLIRVGRSRANNLVLRDRTLSRFHLSIQRDASGTWFVEDADSRHGTRLNKLWVVKPEPLAPGDEIRLGDLCLVFDAPVGGASSETTGSTVSSWSGCGTGEGPEPVELVGKSERMCELRSLIDRIAPSTATVLITGENGTGKELAARLIHARSERAGGPFVVVNCPALPATLIEAELFGVAKGVATGVEQRVGRFELASGGTLLLDEIGDMDLGAQTRLLRFLQERVVECVGGREPLAVDVRVLATTHHDLEQDIAHGTFRRDLYHRLKTVSLRLPALRERREDIPTLVDHFLERAGRSAASLDQKLRRHLERYDYPGNVRELEHVIEGAALLAQGRSIEVEDLPPEFHGSADEASDPDQEAALLHGAVVGRGESFWDAVHEPFLRRRLSRQAVRLLLQRAWDETGSYMEMARLFRIEEEYRRFINFIHYHGLRVKK